MEKEIKDFRNRIMLILSKWGLLQFSYGRVIAEELSLSMAKDVYCGTSPFLRGFTLPGATDLILFFETLTFQEFLQGVEHLISILKNIKTNEDKPRQLAQELSRGIVRALEYARIDIGIRFDAEQGIFYLSGAKLLDERLVNDNLRWLREKQYTKVYEPFEKGLRFLLESKNDPKKLSDAVTDLHEALEAFAKIVCGNDRDLSGNRDRFISALNLNPYYQKMLKEYINYANEFRHAEKQRKARPDLKYEEIEAFVYLTGLFIRLGIEKLDKKK